MTRWIIAGGGTGGHVTPALALGEVIHEAGDPVLFVGTRRGIERRLVPEAGFELELLDSRPFVGRSAGERVRALLALARGTLRARRLLRRFRADLVIAVGGYASAAPALAARSCRLPLVLVNTDAVPGVANRLLGRLARRIFVGFPGAAEILGRGGGDPRVRVSGVPLRRELCRAFATRPAPAPPHEPSDLRHLFVFGGSQGARQINDLMLAALPELDPARLRVVHQTGERDRQRVAEAYVRAGFSAEVVAFERDMARRYREAQLVVCRAGAITVAELALCGRAALLLPLAHVGGGEQPANARELEKCGGARVLDSRQLSPTEFVRELRSLLEDPARLEAMSRAAASLARPRAAEEIVAACRELVEARAG